MNRISRMPKILHIEEPFDGCMIFVAVPAKPIYECDTTKEVNLKIESFVRMSNLPEKMQKEIREYLIGEGLLKVT